MNWILCYVCLGHWNCVSTTKEFFGESKWNGNEVCDEMESQTIFKVQVASFGQLPRAGVRREKKKEIKLVDSETIMGRTKGKFPMWVTKKRKILRILCWFLAYWLGILSCSLDDYANIGNWMLTRSTAPASGWLSALNGWSAINIVMRAKALTRKCWWSEKITIFFPLNLP